VAALTIFHGGLNTALESLAQGTGTSIPVQRLSTRSLREGLDGSKLPAGLEGSFAGAAGDRVLPANALVRLVVKMAVVPEHEALANYIESSSPISCFPCCNRTLHHRGAQRRRGRAP